nr:bifunctional diaminohydroxyphosphoribosylaminopyrimidine deaminase/5-amino-6-(5-phosphoribosylamino)uracil reductase RibD [Corynebacterium lactis]
MAVFPDLLTTVPLSDAAAMRLAIDAGQRVRGTTYPNPPVGCVVLDANGIVVGAAGTEPTGGLHAEPQALAMAGERARGGTAVVTLEPCNHQGRTPPCTGALLRAGVARVVYAVADPNPVASGGSQWLSERGIEVVGSFRSPEVADGYLRPWLHWQATRRPHITLKTAGTLDGFAAATDRTSQWITGPEARAHVHVDRSRRQAIVVGTGTVAADDPQLTARDSAGELASSQPLRIVIGNTEVPEDARIRGEGFRQIRTHDIEVALDVMADMSLVDVLVEGGPRLAAAFLQANAVDAIESYVAPAFLMAGLPVTSGPEHTTIGDITRFRTQSVETLGGDVLIRAVRA